MKSFLSLLIVCAFSMSALHATIITVDNNSVSAGQYSDLQLAANNASAGDTLHIIGSLTSYGNVQIEKPLTLIGAGHNPPNQFHLPTTLGTLYLSESLPNNASGSRFIGMEIASLSWWVNSIYDNITIERCRIVTVSLYNGNCSNWLIQNNIITNMAINDNANIILRNNIIIGAVTNSDEPTVLVTNNLFTKSVSTPFFASIEHAMIVNNIFFQGGSPTGCINSTFNNNLTFSTPNNTIPYGSNIGANNQVGVDPQFNNVTGTGFDYANDYRTPMTSPVVDAGTDGTDIGIYGGTSPMAIGGAAPYLTSAPPRIPQIMELNLLTPTIFQGDSLTVQVKARKQN